MPDFDKKKILSNRCFYVDGADKPQTMTTKMAESRRDFEN